MAINYGFRLFLANMNAVVSWSGLKRIFEVSITLQSRSVKT